MAGEGGEVLIVSLNLGEDRVRIADPPPGQVLAGSSSGIDSDELVVGPHGWAVITRR